MWIASTKIRLMEDMVGVKMVTFNPEIKKKIMHHSKSEF